MIDPDFIQNMNKNVKNIALYVNPKRDLSSESYLPPDNSNEEAGATKAAGTSVHKAIDNVELFCLNQGYIHMYQKDIAGLNAIDHAFRKNSFFCIKAFVETLLIMTDEGQFNNCFDKAILQMIAKGMDVKELVNSELFYVPVWTHLSLFSATDETEFLGYNEEIEELEFEDPNELFQREEEKEGQDITLGYLTKSFVEKKQMEKKHQKKAQDIEV